MNTVRGKAVQTGLDELDELVCGGIPSGSPFLISGAAGTGKTTLALQYIWNGLSKYGEKAVFFTYEEMPEQLIANAASFGWDLRPYVERGDLTFCHTLLPNINPNEQLLLIERAVRESGARRAVVDSLTMLMGGVDDATFVRQQVFNLTAILRNEDCTALIISDPPINSDRISRFGVEESIIDGVIILRIQRDADARRRTLEVFKMRGVNHATGEHTMKITGEGVKLFPRVEVLS
jgi:circadian clock protein KaiC